MDHDVNSIRSPVQWIFSCGIKKVHFKFSTSMKTNILLLLCSAVIAESNQYPIVLVHGFMGWGREEMLGMKYWGGIQGDLQEILQNDGHQVFTAAVGPLSSNWDRACELYTQIRGGRVDYGEAHAEKYGHHRYGRTYSGLYPEWGTKDENGEIRKVHFIAHSMGGQTVRVLARLLQYGTLSAPVEEKLNNSSLFSGNKDWIHSITTISTPHQGTILSNGFSIIGNEVKAILAAMLSLAGAAGDLSKVFYDVKMDQWDIGPKRSNESLTEYMDRVLSSELFESGCEDISLFDLSTPGAEKLNSWVTTSSNTYHFSYSTRDTYESSFLWRKVSKPYKLSMLWPLQPISLFLGGLYTTFNQGKGAEWQPNDGIVNTISMKGTNDVPVVSFSRHVQPGQWNHMPLLDRIDHTSVLGFTVLKDLISFYRTHARILSGLPRAVKRSRFRPSQVNGDLIQDLTKIIHQMTRKIQSL